MRVRTLSTADDPAYDDYVGRHPLATFFHCSGWRDQVVLHCGHRPHYLAVEGQAGALCGVLPLFLIRSPLLGRAFISVPYAVYGGVLADDVEGERLLIEAVRAAMLTTGARHAEFRYLHRPGVDLPTSDLYVTFLRDLPDHPDKCLEMIPRKSRASTRHARDKHGMELFEERTALDEFYELFVQNKRALGSPVFSRSYFQSLLDRFGERVLLHVVRCEGQVIAACVSFVHGGVLNPYYSGSVPGTERLGSMNFLYWRLMEEGVKKGLTRFDFGRSRAGTGACNFKINMGFEPTPLPYQYLLAPGAKIPSVNPSNPRFDFVKNTWSRLPVSLVKRLGPRLMRYLP